MTVPPPFPYQGSQRALVPLILQYLPISTTRLVEPFCGSAAGSRSAAVPGPNLGLELDLPNCLGRNNHETSHPIHA